MSGKSVTAVVLAGATILVGLAGCDGGGGGGGGDPIRPQPRLEVVTVEVPAGATFHGFDIAAVYDATRLTPLAPLTDAAMAVGPCSGCSCQVSDVASTLRIACVNTAIVRGPGEVVRFSFNSGSLGASLAHVDVTCVFVDDQGQEVAVSCSSEMTP